MISKGDFIKLSYTARLEDGTVIDTTDEKIAKEYGIFRDDAKYEDIYVIVGEGHIVKGLDEDLEGKEVGYKGEVVAPPEKAFGEYDPENKDVFSITRFKERPEIGQRVRIGDKVGTVERIIGRRVIVDFNHPLAGKSIKFDYEIKEVLENPEDKLKALFRIHTGVNVLDVKIEDGKAIVEVTSDTYLNQIFLIGRYRVAKDAFRFLQINELEIVERFKRDDEVLKFVSEVKEEEKSKGEESREDES
ncbi:MAG: peptidylprolyl isomerase [Candidatus Methanomethylicota archaeon]|uniref:Peptidyl-prolyl cis-trans isomerase n=1 Tax=Thermoproteota archaeon TaxID=2056631 RepID=A0A497EM15_9CREN|nr:MAG: peptidylprolyl isomerase [Candidatus Verstraetearchaeota archaeon]